MGMSRLISQLFFGFFFSWKYHTQASTMSSFSGCAKSTQTSQPTHTSCHSYTASHRAHQHTDGSVTILCWSFSLFLSLLQTIHHTEFVSQDCFCLLLSASYCYIHFCIIFCFLRGFCAHANFECLRVLSGCDCFSKCFLNEALATLNKIN